MANIFPNIFERKLDFTNIYFNKKIFWSKKFCQFFINERKNLIEINLAIVKVDLKNLITLFLFLTVFLNNQRNEDNSDFYGNEIASVAIIWMM